MHPTDPNWNPNHSDWWPAKRNKLFRENFDNIKWDKNCKPVNTKNLTPVKNQKNSWAFTSK